MLGFSPVGSEPVSSIPAVGAAAVADPFVPQAWANPGQPRAGQNLTVGQNLLLTVLAVAAAAPFIPGRWDNPQIRVAPQQVHASPNLLLTTLAPAAVPFRSGVWPNPAIAPAIRVDAGSPNLLTSLLRPPFVPGDWPNPRQSRWVQPDQAPNLLTSTLSVVAAPFASGAWPNPQVTPARIGWQNGTPTVLLSQPVTAPFVPGVWPNPVVVSGAQAHQAPNLLTSTLGVVGASPFVPRDWPNAQVRTRAGLLVVQQSLLQSTLADATISRPDADVAAGGWLPSTGSDLYPMIDEVVADDSDYIYATAAFTCRERMSDVTTPAPTNAQIVSYRAWSDSGNGLKVRLYCGAVLVAEWVHATLPTTPTTYQQALGPAEIALITDYTDLFMEMEST